MSDPPAADPAAASAPPADQLSAGPVAAPPVPAPPATTPATTTATPASLDAPPTSLGDLGIDPFDVTYGQGSAHVTRVERDPASPGQVRASVAALDLPPTKGPWSNDYDVLAKAGRLQAVVDVSSSTPSSALWQKRAGSPELRRLWRVRAGWPTGDDVQANKWWNEAGGKPHTGEFNPATKGGAAQIDHVVELQLGGSNVPENLAPHDGADNMDSGRKIFGQVSEVAKAVKRSAHAVPNLHTVILRYASAIQSTPYAKDTDLLPPIPADPAARQPALDARKDTAQTALQVHFTALRDQADHTRPTAEEQQEEQGRYTGMPDYVIRGGANSATLKAPEGRSDIDIETSDFEANRAARELIPGIALEKVRRAANPNQVVGWFGSEAHPVRSGTRLPVSIAGGAGRELDFGVQPDRSLRIVKGGQGLEFVYPYLSRGRMNVTDGANGIVGDGTLTPSVPLLSRAMITVHLEQNALSGSIAADPSKLTLPSPMRITDASINVSLAPELAVNGHLGFAVGQLLDGELTATVDGQGFVARGRLVAHVPHLDQAEGQVEYRPATGLTGFVVVSASPGGVFQHAEVRLDFTPAGFGVTGTVDLALPGGDNTAHLQVRRHGDGLLYVGRAHLTVPGLHPVDAEIEYDGEHIEGVAETTFRLLGADGTIKVIYRDGHFSGTGQIAIRRDKFTGSLEAHLDSQGRLSGRGQGAYTIRPGLVATAAVELTPEHKLHVTGELRFPPYRLFERHGDHYQLFRTNLPPIPLFGFSLGPLGSIGIVATVGAGLSADYWFGPGEIRDLLIRASFDPLEDDANLDLQAGARLVIPAHAGLSLTGRLGLGLSAAVATLTGGVDLTATVGVDGGFNAGLAVRFHGGVFVLDATAGIRAQPSFGLSIGVDFSIETLVHDWTWGPYELARFQYDTGLLFGLDVPVHYASNEPFRLPEINDIHWITPAIDVGDLADRIGSRVRTWMDV